MPFFIPRKSRIPCFSQGLYILGFLHSTFGMRHETVTLLIETRKKSLKSDVFRASETDFEISGNP